MKPQGQRGERAVSPVVGVSLLIGITVILAAVIGVVVLGIGVGPADTPEATLSFEVDDDGAATKVIVVHEGGDQLEEDEIVIRDENGTTYELDLDDGEFVTGEREEIVRTDGSPLDLNNTSVEQLTVVWQAPRGNSETALATFRP